MNEHAGGAESAEPVAVFRIVRYPLNPSRIGIEGPVTPYSPHAIDPWGLVGWIASPSGYRVPVTEAEIEEVSRTSESVLLPGQGRSA